MWWLNIDSVDLAWIFFIVAIALFLIAPWLCPMAVAGKLALNAVTLLVAAFIAMLPNV